MINLLLYDRLAQGAADRQNITHHAPDWVRSIRAMGGYWTGDFTITSPTRETPQGTMGRAEMINLYNRSMGMRMVEKSESIVTWEGEIVEMTLTLDGVEYRRTLDTNLWHNNVAVNYPAGLTAFSEDTDSSDIYGESAYIDTVGAAYNATAATARRDRLLAENAFPRSRAMGGLGSDVQGTTTNSLQVMCAGYVFSINRRFRVTDTAPANLSAHISTLIGESEFVTAGRISTNTLQAPISTEGIPTRLWDLIEEMIDMGDASGDRWVGGVWEGREFHYREAETAVTHTYADGRLYDKVRVLVPTSQIRPDIIVRIAGGPSEIAPLSGTDLDRYAYIEEVEFIAPHGFRLIPRYGRALEGSNA